MNLIIKKISSMFYIHLAESFFQIGIYLMRTLNMHTINRVAFEICDIRISDEIFSKLMQIKQIEREVSVLYLISACSLYSFYLLCYASTILILHQTFLVSQKVNFIK